MKRNRRKEKGKALETCLHRDSCEYTHMTHKIGKTQSIIYKQSAIKMSNVQRIKRQKT